MAIQFFADIVDNFLTDETHEIAFAKVEEPAQQKQDQDADDDEVQGINIFIGQYLIDDVLDQPGDDDVARPGQGHTDDGENEPCLIGFYES